MKCMCRKCGERPCVPARHRANNHICSRCHYRLPGRQKYHKSAKGRAAAKRADQKWLSDPINHAKRLNSMRDKPDAIAKRAAYYRKNKAHILAVMKIRQSDPDVR